MPNFIPGLMSLSRPEGPLIRKKIYPLFFKIQQTVNYTRALEGLRRLQPILSFHLNCTTSLHELHKVTKIYEWLFLMTNVTTWEIIQDKNCTQLSGKNEQSFCHLVSGFDWESHIHKKLSTSDQPSNELGIEEMINNCFLEYNVKLKNPISYR